MAGSTFGPIVGQIKADTSDFNKKMGESARKAETFAQRAGKGIKGIGKAIASAKGAFIAFAAVLAIKGTFSAITSAIERLDKLGDTASKIGFTTDALQELRFAASQVNVEQIALDVGLQRFSRRLGEARVGTGELKQALLDNNIALVDSQGHARSSAAVLNDFADAIMNAGDSSEQLRLATKGFDTEGAALVNIFKGGAAAIRAFGDEAKAAGLIIEESIIENAGEAGDKLDLMSKVLRTQATAALAQAAPAITSLGVAFSQALPDMIAFFEGIFVAQKNRSLPTLAKELDEITKKIEEQRAKIKANKDPSTGFADPLAGFARKLAQEDLNELLDEQAEKMALIAAREKEQADRSEKRTLMLREQQKLASEAAVKQAEIAKLQAEEAEAIKAKDKAAEVAAALQKKTAEDKKKQIDDNIAALAKEREAFIKMGDPLIAIREDLIKISELIQAEENPEAIRALEEAWLQVAEKVNEAVEAEEDVDEKTEDLTKSFADMGATFESAFESAVLGGGKLGDIFNGLIKDIIRMTIRALILQPLMDALGSQGGILGKIFGKAGGGLAPGGSPTLVGERGPELIIPNAPSRVINNHTVNNMGGGQPITIEIVNRGTPQQAIGSRSTQSPKGAITTIILDDIKRDGPISTGFSSAFNLRRGR